MDKDPHSTLQIFVCVCACRVFAWVGRLEPCTLNSQSVPHTHWGGGLWLNTPSAQQNWEKASTIQSFYKLGVRGLWLSETRTICAICVSFFAMVEKVACAKFEANPCYQASYGLIVFFFLIEKGILPVLGLATQLHHFSFSTPNKNFFCTSKPRRLETKNVQFWRQKAIKMGEKRPKDKWVPLSHIKGGGALGSPSVLRICELGGGALNSPSVLRLGGWGLSTFQAFYELVGGGGALSVRSRCSINLGGCRQLKCLTDGGKWRSQQAPVLCEFGWGGLSTVQALWIWVSQQSKHSTIWEGRSQHSKCSITSLGRGGFSTVHRSTLWGGGLNANFLQIPEGMKNSQQCMCSRRWHRFSTIGVHMECWEGGGAQHSVCAPNALNTRCAHHVLSTPTFCPWDWAKGCAHCLSRGGGHTHDVRTPIVQLTPSQHLVCTPSLEHSFSPTRRTLGVLSPKFVQHLKFWEHTRKRQECWEPSPRKL